MNENALLEKYDDVLSPDDLKDILRVGRNTVYKLLSSKKIMSIRIGSQYRIPKTYMLKYLNNNMNNN